MKENQKSLNSLLTGKGGLDSRKLEDIFKSCRQDSAKMRKLIRAFCTSYLIDGSATIATGDAIGDDSKASSAMLAEG